MLFIAILVVLLMLPGCPSGSEFQEKVTLITGGYGYEVGDIALIDTIKTPNLGDIVQYDAEVNNSFCMAFGSGIYLAKIIGLPGDSVSFERWSYEANGYQVTLERYYQANGKTVECWPKTRQVMWGTEIFDDLAGMRLEVPANEYLSDTAIGQECTGEKDATGSSKTYNRFTVRREAIRGVIIKKLGHDEEFEQRQKSIIY